MNLTHWGSVAVLVLLIGAIVALACAAEGETPTTATVPAPPETPRPTSTPTPVPTAIPTPIPPPTSTPTPAPRMLRCGDTITADTVLANDITCGEDIALIIGADNLRLDLAGHTLKGPGRGPWVWPRRALASIAVFAGRRTGVWIGNGTITGFATGVLLEGTTSSEVSTPGHYRQFLRDLPHRIGREPHIWQLCQAEHLWHSSTDVQPQCRGRQ